MQMGIMLSMRLMIKLKILMNNKMGAGENYDSEDSTASLSAAGKIYGCLKGATLGITFTPFGKGN